ncbi:MAG: serine/threonine protein kinase [Gemmataceae bacterium]|nr:serine/threonine protein kinase [Gemmataceae bacterium]
MLVGKEIGPYVIDKELGAGAMGTVYRGKHKQSGQKVAIKIVIPALIANDVAMKRFGREIEVLEKLKHPNIVKYIGKGKLGKSPFFVMEYIEGESLDHVMERRGRITWEEIIPLGQQLCAALQHAHEKGIIHRDLKPSNLMVLKDGAVKLTDFGIARDTDQTALTRAHATVGTAAYMSPEQCQGEKNITVKSDLYSMGIMFYELVTGKKPFVGDSAMEVFLKHMNDPFERPARQVLDIPVWFDTLICQLMEKEPDKRPLNAETVSQSLGMIQEKVLAQQSAGIDAAKRRRADKTARDVALDEDDKEAARSLLGKKKKEKAVPFYQQGWFTVLALVLVLLGLGYGFYALFLKTPSAESYHERALALLKSTSVGDRKEGRQAIDEFLRHYKDHALASAMRDMADQYDLETCESSMLNRRRGGFSAENEAEKLAFEALDNEDQGKLSDAGQIWQQLEKYVDKPGEGNRGWGLLGRKYRTELKSVDTLYQQIVQKVEGESKSGKKLFGESKAERLALEAVRNPQALSIWSDLKQDTKNEPENRRWHLLAAQKLRELSEKK